MSLPTTRDLKWMTLVDCGAKTFSTCSKRQYMSIIIDNQGHVIGLGYNGGPKGMKHCNEGGCKRLYEESKSGSTYDNCFAGDTRFLTRDGIYTLEEKVGQAVEVLTSRGWKPAHVKQFGSQPLWKINIKRYGYEKSILATANHRWFIYDSHRKRREVTTEQLRAQHYLVSAYPRTGELRGSDYGIKAGLVFGDGSTNYDQPGSGSWISLYGPATSLAFLWDGTGHEGETFRGMPRMWKTHSPDPSESYEYLYGWLQGYFAADGTLSHSTPIINSTERWRLEAAKDVATMLGIPTLGIRSTTRDTNFKDNSEIFTLTFPQGALPGNFFLLWHHRNKATERAKTRDLPRWSVVSVEYVGVAPVYCVVEPETKEFTLDDQILTGNCIAIHAEANAIIHSDYTARTKGATLYVNGPPCFGCAKLIANSGIERVVYKPDSSYTDWPNVHVFLLEAGVELVEIG